MSFKLKKKQFYKTWGVLLWVFAFIGLCVGECSGQTASPYKFPSSIWQVNGSVNFLQQMTFTGPQRDYIVIGFYNSTATLDKAAAVTCADIKSYASGYLPEQCYFCSGLQSLVQGEAIPIDGRPVVISPSTYTLRPAGSTYTINVGAWTGSRMGSLTSGSNTIVFCLTFADTATPVR